MAKRNRVIRADSVIHRLDGQQQLTVSREAAQTEVLGALEVLLLAGGEFTVSSQRSETEFPGEAVPTAVFITWHSGSARSSRPQPEQTVEPKFVEPVPAREPDEDYDDEADEDESPTPFDDVEDLTAAR